MKGIKAQGIIADKRQYAAIKWYKSREILARVKTFIKVIFNANPKFLGKKIPITGDSRKSWD
jgi:vancomycin permeability regulator SanA